MAISVTHTKIANIPDFTQEELDVRIAAKQYPEGTTLNDIALNSDWNDEHTITGVQETLPDYALSSVLIGDGTNVPFATDLLTIDHENKIIDVVPNTVVYVQPPTNLVASKSVAPQYEGWPEESWISNINFRVYSFKEHPSGTVYYSQGYATLSVPVAGDGSYDPDFEEPWFFVDLSWDAPTTGEAPDGYRITVEDPDYTGWAHEAGYDVYATTTYQANTADWNEGLSAVTPTEYQVNTLNINAITTIAGQSCDISAPTNYTAPVTFNDITSHYGQTFQYNTMNVVGAEIVSDSLITGGTFQSLDYKINSAFILKSGSCLKINSETTNFTTDSIHIGQDAGKNNSGARNFFFGTSSGAHTTASTIYDCTGIAQNSLKDIPTGYYLVGIGNGAMQGVGTGYTSVAIGFQAAYLATSINNSVATGFWAGKSSSNINNAVLQGVSAGEGANNNFTCYTGYQSGKSATNATNSCGYGSSSLLNSTNADQAAAYGTGSLANAPGAAKAAAFGALAGGSATNATYSFFGGHNAGNAATNAAHMIAIGANAGQADTVNNTASGWSILLGRNTKTGGFQYSIALGGYVLNSAARQLNIGNVVYATNIYNGTSQSSAPVSDGRLGVGVAAPHSTLQSGGSVAGAVRTITANRTLDVTDNHVKVDASTGAITVTLPSAIGISGREYTIKKIDASGNAVTLATTLLQTIDGATTRTLAAQYDYIRVKSDGANWDIVG